VSEFTSGLGDTFAPTEGTTLGTFTLSGKGCGALAGTFPIKGSFDGEAEPLNTPLVTQPLRFGRVQDEEVTASGLTDALTFGTSAMYFEGTMNTTLTGANGGLQWGAQ
jgi:hypothetical protein